MAFESIRSSLTPANVLAPIHLLCYSTLLGTEVWQTFTMTKLCYQALPRSAFTTLQKRVFPIYFRTQSALLLLSAATLTPSGPLSLVASKENCVVFGIAGLTAMLNVFVYEPRTRQAMINRIHQGEFAPHVRTLVILGLQSIRLDTNNNTRDEG
jgi:hypothetical protein